jgi:hypothetical protein
MTVAELIKELKKYPSDMAVTKVTDWDDCDEFGNLPTADIECVSTQTYFDTQMGDNDLTEVLIY